MPPTPTDSSSDSPSPIPLGSPSSSGRSLHTGPGWSPGSGVSSARLRTTPRRSLHARLALLLFDPSQVKDVYRRLLGATPTEMTVIRDQLAPHRYALITLLWGELRAARPGDPRILPVAGTLAGYDPENHGWNEVAGKVADAMVRAPLGDSEGWRKAMRVIRARLIGPLAEVRSRPGSSG